MRTLCSPPSYPVHTHSHSCAFSQIRQQDIWAKVAPLELVMPLLPLLCCSHLTSCKRLYLYTLVRVIHLPKRQCEYHTRMMRTDPHTCTALSFAFSLTSLFLSQILQLADDSYRERMCVKEQRNIPRSLAGSLHTRV
jgi:hypothetical protein